MMATRVNKLGQQYTLIGGLGSATTTIICQRNNKRIEVQENFEAVSRAWYTWQILGESVQDAFSSWSPGEREFIMTGIDDAEWKTMMAEVDEEVVEAVVTPPTQQCVIVDQFCFFSPYYAQNTKAPFTDLVNTAYLHPTLLEGPHGRKPIIKDLSTDDVAASKDPDVVRGTTVFRAAADGTCEAWLRKWDT